ncbi:EpsG family protein [Gammaproteobacteria bacterium]|nr:EpsG family protein [Gammaproteobacteria bacterium]
MFFYWLLFFIPAFFALVSSSRKPSSQAGFHSTNLNPLWWAIIFVLTFFIGLRHEVGGDWINYIYMLEKMAIRPTAESFTLMSDPGYNILSYISLKLGWGIYGVNLFCGFIFSIGLSVFCRNLPRPLLALAVSIPYLVIVVAMGYSRQGVALGIAMLGLVALTREKRFKFIMMICIATTLHKSAFLLLPIAVLASTRNRFLIFSSFFILIGLVYSLFLSTAYETLITNYVDSQYASQGAFIRLLMNAFPAAIFLLWRHRFNFNQYEEPLWVIFSYLSLLLLSLFYLTDASTALDRIGLYMLPLQLVVFSSLPEIFKKSGNINQWIVISILSYYSLVLFVWLNFATHAGLWLPYKNYAFIS